MPTMMEMPERPHEEVESPPREDIHPPSAGSRPRLWHRVLACLVVHGSASSCLPQSNRSCIGNPAQPEMQPIDRLARDFPYLYTLATCG